MNSYYLTISAVQEFKSGLARWSWLRCCHEVVVKMSAGLYPSEGLTVENSLSSRLTQIFAKLMLVVGRRPQFSLRKPLHRAA